MQLFDRGIEILLFIIEFILLKLNKRNYIKLSKKICYNIYRVKHLKETTKKTKDIYKRRRTFF